MSASLVGSEMCIRDRRKTLSLQNWPLRSISYATTARRRATGAHAARAPVSYTHLTLPTICSV
eukprot:8092644-Alexandrium_andersonii.AAC.1